MDKRQVKRLGIILLIELVVGMAGGFVVSRARTARQDQLAASQAVLAQAKSDAGELNSLIVNVSALEREMGHLEKPTVKDVDYVPTLMLQLVDLAHRTGVQFTSYKPGSQSAAAPASQPSPPASAPPPAAGSTTTVPSREVSITVAGNFRQHMAFLAGLSKFPKIVAIQPAELRSAGVDLAGHPVMDVQMKLTCYMLPQEERKSGS
ncbi:MAG TPA: hypothetical protein VGN26_20420 [Armatimonadota bacterium]